MRGYQWDVNWDAHLVRLNTVGANSRCRWLVAEDQGAMFIIEVVRLRGRHRVRVIIIIIHYPAPRRGTALLRRWTSTPPSRGSRWRWLGRGVPLRREFIAEHPPAPGRARLYLMRKEDGHEFGF